MQLIAQHIKARTPATRSDDTCKKTKPSPLSFSQRTPDRPSKRAEQSALLESAPVVGTRASGIRERETLTRSFDARWKNAMGETALALCDSCRRRSAAARTARVSKSKGALFRRKAPLPVAGEIGEVSARRALDEHASPRKFHVHMSVSTHGIEFEQFYVLGVGERVRRRVYEARVLRSKSLLLKSLRRPRSSTLELSIVSKSDT